ncbi:MAG: hypothetical protein ACRDHZ_05095 [Ktedonobacteraceae bacterium]
MSSVRTLSFVLLILCVLGGLVAALFSPTLAATLAVPTPAVGQVATAQPVQPVVEPTSIAPTQPVVGPTNIVVAQPTPLPSGVTMLVQDTFQRPNQALWGQSSDGQIWNGDANSSPLFSIVKHAGQISGGKGTVQAIMLATFQDSDLLVSATVNQFNAHGTSNFGVVLRWQDSQNWYKALIDGSTFQLLKSVQGKISVLVTQPFHAVGGTAYSIRFRALGSNLFGRVWPSAQPEPTTWAWLAIDTALRTGNSGIRVLLTSHTVMRLNSFVETTVPNVV